MEWSKKAMATKITTIPQVYYRGSGAAAARPAAAGLRNGSTWFSTDTLDIDQVVAGAWVTVFDSSAVGAAHAATHIPGGADPMRWTAAKLLLGAGAGADPTLVSPNAKEIFFPATAHNSGDSFDNLGDFPKVTLQNSDEGYTIGRIPSDFNSIVSIVILTVHSATDGALPMDITSDYAAAGEAYNAHSESDTASTYAVTQNELEEIDVSGIFTALAANDYFGVGIERDHVTSAVYVLGVLLIYN